MKNLPLPLHCYDAAGRVLPSTLFNLVFLWGARAVLLVIASFVLGEQGKQLPTVLLPLKWQLPAHFSIGVVFIILWFVQGRREWFWKNNYSIAWFKPVLILLFLIDMGLQVTAIGLTHGEFNFYRSAVFVMTSFTLIYLINSRRTRIMFKDWSA